MAKKNENNQSENLFNSGFEIESEIDNSKISNDVRSDVNINSENINKFSSTLPPTDDEQPPFDLDETNNVVVSETNKTESENESESVSLKEKEVHQISNISEIVGNISKFDEFKKLFDEAIVLSKKIVIISGDIDNASAREYGKNLTEIKNRADEARKDYNKPYQKIIDDNNDSFNDSIINPVKKEIERLKQAIAFYEGEKEKKRIAEAKKLADEQKAKEEKERLERERVSKIRESISKIQTEGIANLEKCNTLAELNTYEAKITGWKLKPEYYSEFIEEAEKQKSALVLLISQRKPLLEEIDRKQKEADKLQGEAKEAAQKEADAKAKELEAKKKEDEENNEALTAQNKELEAQTELTILVASFGLKRVEDYIKSVIEKYGTATNAIANRDKLVDDYRESLIQKTKVDANESEKVKNVRLTFEFTITNESLIPIEFLSVDEQKIKKYILANREKLEKDINSVKIDGLILYPKKTTILK
jgi:hypothetical protein